MKEEVDGVLIKCGMSSGAERQYHTERCRIVEQFDSYRRISCEVLSDSWVECAICAGEDERPSNRVVRVCPLCGDEVPNLPQHMRACR